MHWSLFLRFFNILLWRLWFFCLRNFLSSKGCWNLYFSLGWIASHCFRGRVLFCLRSHLRFCLSDGLRRLLLEHIWIWISLCYRWCFEISWFSIRYTRSDFNWFYNLGLSSFSTHIAPFRQVWWHSRSHWFLYVSHHLIYTGFSLFLLFRSNVVGTLNRCSSFFSSTKYWCKILDVFSFVHLRECFV